MNIQNVNQADSWARFMQIVEDARTRSAGPSAAPPPKKVKSAFALPVRDIRTPPAPMPGAHRAFEGLKTPPQSPGSYFDAYA